MLNDELVACCKRLRLSRTLADPSDFAKDQTPERYLLYVLKRELEHREKNRRDRLLKAAGFHSWKTFDNYRFDDIKLPAGVTPEYLAKAAFVEEKKNLILYGNVGTGKTHLATAIGIEACRRGLRTGFYRTAHLVNRLSEAKKEGKLGETCDLAGQVGPFDLRRMGLRPPGPGSGPTALPDRFRQLRRKERDHHHKSRIQPMDRNLLR